MRKRLGLVLLASLTLSSVLLVAGTSSAAAVSTPKGKVYVGIEAIDPDNSPNVVAFGEGPNPVPMVMIDYNTGLCQNDKGDHLPVIWFGLVNIRAADGAGVRLIESKGAVHMQCTSPDRTIWFVDSEFVYDSQTDSVSIPDTDVTMDRACNGQPVPGFNTVIGTSAPETLVGTAGRDLIDGRGGSDKLRGKGGHDIVCGGAGNDIIKGGAGIDLLIGQDGRDKLYGEDGMDLLLGGDNPKAKKREVLDGGTSGDALFGWMGRDLLFGRSGSDVLFGGPSSDKHSGGTGSDACYDGKSTSFASCETVAAGMAEPIHIVGPFAAESPEGQVLLAELDAFIAGEVLDYTYEWTGDLAGAITADNPPDLVIVPQPGLIVDLADELVDISDFFANLTLLPDSFGEYLIDQVTVESEVLGGPIRTGLKSLVWYKPAKFAAEGYSIPTTFAELVALSDEMVADAETPWCNFMENAPATGWLGTDWVEDLLLGAKRGDFYDSWVDHSVLFTDAAVDKAFDRFVRMIDTESYVFERADMLTSNIWENAPPLVDEACLMHKQAAFFAPVLGEDVVDFATFKFPAVNATNEDAVMGGGNYVAATNDSPAVKAFVRFMLKAKFGKAAIVDGSGWILPHMDFNNALYTDDLTRGWANDVQDALANDLFRFDASDLMPAKVGAVFEGGPGTFWLAIAELVNGDKTVPQVLVDIDDSWP